MKVLTCTECGGLWGAVLDQPSDTPDNARAALTVEAESNWADEWEIERLPDWPVTPPPMPSLVFRAGALPVVYVSDADAGFLSDRGCDVIGGCWQSAGDVDAPLWWLNNRRRRSGQAALVKDCGCSNPPPLPRREYARAVAAALVAVTAA